MIRKSVHSTEKRPCKRAYFLSSAPLFIFLSRHNLSDFDENNRNFGDIYSVGIGYNTNGVPLHDIASRIGREATLQ